MTPFGFIKIFLKDIFRDFKMFQKIIFEISNCFDRSFTFHFLLNLIRI